MSRNKTRFGVSHQLIKFVQNFVPKITVRKSDNQYAYGANDLAPNELANAITDSGTASRAIEKLSQFIAGDGFASELLKNARANKKQSINEFLNDVCQQVAAFHGVAIKVVFSLDLSRAEFYVLEFQKCRNMEGGKILYNKSLGEPDYKKSDDIIYPQWWPSMPKEEVMAMLELQKKQHGGQIGFIYYNYIRSIKNKHYPIPPQMSGIEDLQSDAALQKLDRRNIVKGFRANVVITLNGELDNETKDDKGKTQRDYFGENIREFQGEEAKSVLVLEGKTPESTPSVSVLPIADVLDGVDKSRDRIPRAVCRHIGVPPVLIGMSMTEGLGNTQAILNALKIFQLDITKLQNFVRGIFKDTLGYVAKQPDLDFKIVNLKLIEQLPSEFYAALTQDEIRELGGYPPLTPQNPPAP